MAALDTLKAAFGKLKGSKTNPFEENQTISQWSLDNGANLTTAPSATFKKDSTFAFVPVYNEDASVDIYVRLGGPEAILKEESELYEVSSSVPKGLDLRTAFGDKGGFQFGKKYDTLAADDDDLNYNLDYAPERLLIQRAVLDFKGWGQYMPLVRRLYPLRLKANARTSRFELQYAPLGAEDYSSIKIPNILADFEMEMIASLLTIMSRDKTSNAEVLLVLKDLKTEGGQSSLVTHIMTEFEADFKDAIITHALTFDDDVGVVGNADNDYDAIFFAAFAQFTSPFSKTTVEIAKSALRQINNIKSQITIEEIRGAQSIVTAFVNMVGLDAEGADQTLKAQIDTQASEITKLKSEKEKVAADLEAKLKGAGADVADARKRERIIGAVSAGAVTIWAMQDEKLKDLDMLQKGILVVAGGALGALMPSGYSPLAVLAAPITASMLGKQLVHHGVTAESARAKYSQLSDSARSKYSQLSDSARSKYRELRDRSSAGYLPAPSADDDFIDVEAVERNNPRRRKRNKTKARRTKRTR